ncbi:MAG: DUF1385 domain-containing protein [Oscillospiraceae bacterium]|nr:DUF1385 domain-containing protein [Oscillospiraceae bacterium]
MMRGPFTTAMAVRKPDGELDISQWETEKGAKPWYKKAPFIRGSFNFIDSMAVSYKCLMKSAEIAGFEEEPSAFEKKLEKLFGESFSKVLSGFAMILGVLLAVLLFMVLPTVLVSLIKPFISSQWLMALCEAVVKIAIFMAYIIAISQMSDIKRVFQYHGAEHKTIACYEAQEELTVENVRKHTRFHPRCGTSFILIVLLLSLIVGIFLPRTNMWLRFGVQMLCLIPEASVAYELIKIAGKYDNFITRIISAPGLWLQRITTKEPTDKQIECAIAALKPCLPKEGEEDKW